MPSLPPKIEDLIPHRDRMKLIDEILEIADNRCVTRAVVNRNWPLCEKGFVSTIILIEVVAQTASALIGWERKNEERIGGHGLLVGVKRAEWTASRLPVGVCLVSRVETLHKQANYAVFKGIVEVDSDLRAEVHIQAFRP
ncbi:hypothetical protein ACFL4G_01845 [Thermodesulfobacteriota bacterium]